MLGVRSRPIRTVLIWQIVATLVIAVAGALVSGEHGAISGALGGLIGVVGGLAFSWSASRNQAGSADAVLFAALKAEGIKVLVFIALLALVLAAYQNVVVLALIGAFIVSTLIFGFAFFVRDA
jgi:ATP synthase protein I